MLIPVVFLSAVFAGFIQYIAGFGAGIVMMIFFPYYLGVIGAASLSQAICTGMVIIVAWKYRAYIEKRYFLLPTVFYLITSQFILLTIGKMNVRLLSVGLGIFLIALAFYSAFIQKNLKIRPTLVSAVVCGLVAGSFSGFFSLGAAPAALYMLSVTEDREHYLGNLQIIFVINNIASLITRYAKGYYTTDLILPTFIGFAGILVGQRFADRFANRLNRVWLSRIVYGMVAVSGLSTVLQHL